MVLDLASQKGLEQGMPSLSKPLKYAAPFGLSTLFDDHGCLVHCGKREQQIAELMQSST